jgi:hypothetical protein
MLFACNLAVLHPYSTAELLQMKFFIGKEMYYTDIADLAFILGG